MVLRAVTRGTETRAQHHGGHVSTVLGDAFPVCQAPLLSKVCLRSSNLLLEGIGGCEVLISYGEVPPMQRYNVSGDLYA